jgi:hypothetical protein
MPPSQIPSNLTQAFFQQLFTQTGTQGMADYFSAQSYGLVNLNNSFVVNWTKAPDSSTTIAGLPRDRQIAHCVDTQKNMPAASLGGLAFGNFYNYVGFYAKFGKFIGNLGNANTCIGATTEDDPNCGGGRYRPAVTADTGSTPDQIEHEMGHGYGLSHSYNDFSLFPGGAGEYGNQFDKMSAAHDLSFVGPLCMYSGGCATGPGFDMWNRNQLGWAPENSIQATPAWPNGYGTYSHTFTLAPRNHKELFNGNTPLALLVEAHQDSSYEVEFIAPDGWERGVGNCSGPTCSSPSNTLTINRVYNSNAGTNSYTPYLLVEPGAVQTTTGQGFDDGPVKIALQSIQGNPPTATVRVSYSAGYTQNNQTWIGSRFVGECGGNLLGDVTGDGKADLVALGCGFVGVEPSAGTSFGPYATWLNGTFKGDCGGNLLGDVTGDGKADLVALGCGFVGVEPSSGTSFGPYATWANATFNYPNGNFLADVNGDGKADLVGVGTSSIVVQLSTGSSFGSPQTWYSSAFAGQFGTLVADVNGDHKADVVALNSGSVNVLLSAGTKFVTTTNPFWNATFNGAKGNLIADVTGDGIADLIGLNSGAIGVGVSTTASFAFETWSTNTFVGDVATFSADVTGDGLADLVAVNSNNVQVLPLVRAP